MNCKYLSLRDEIDMMKNYTYCFKCKIVRQPRVIILI